MLNPNDALAYSRRGAAYGDKGDYDRAIADFSKAVDVNPKWLNTDRNSAPDTTGDKDRATAYTNRGLAYGAKGDNDRAIADLSSAIELNPKDEQAYVYRGSAYASRGALDDAKGDNSRAIADLSKAIELNPKNEQAYLGRGYARFYAGRFKDSAADFLRAIELKRSIYPTLFRYLARSRIGENALSELEATSTGWKPRNGRMRSSSFISVGNNRTPR